MFVSSTVTVNLKGLERFRTQIEDQLNGAQGPIHDALQLWGVRYRSFAQQRFDIYSKGGGDWQPLAASTIKRRRKGTVSNVKALRELFTVKVEKDPSAISGGNQPSILRDTGLLFAALAPIFMGAPGAIEEFIKWGIRVGYGGPQKHSLGNTKTPATIADIAKFHNDGHPPHLPQRIIIADPPLALTDEMARDMDKALAKLAS